MRRLSCDQAVDELGLTTTEPLAVAPGETVVVEVRDCFGGYPGRPPVALRPNPVTGPLAVTGLRAGETLAVDLLAVTPVGDGFVGAPEALIPVPIDGAVARYPGGVTLPVAPNVGTIGVVPAGEAVPTTHAGDHGGNVDCTIIGAGATVCFTARVDGAGLGLGDVHAAMGDGEISGQGVEVAAEVTLRVRRVPGLGLDVPYGLRDGRLFVVGWGSSLDAATDRAAAALRPLLDRLTGLTGEPAHRLLGAAVSLRAGFGGGATPTVWLALPLAVLPAAAAAEVLAAVHP